MDDVSKVLSLLRETVAEPSKLRLNIPKFQQMIWKSEIKFPSDKVEEILGELAYDLDYYEADPRIRGEDVSFLGDERALEEIRSALVAIDSGAK